LSQKGEKSPKRWQFFVKLMTVANISLEFTEAFQRRFWDCFSRRETWERFLLCLHDRLHDSERILPDAAHPEGTGAVRSRQRFLSDAVWDAEKVMARYHEEVRDALGDRDGALVFQTVDFVKKGSDSAGNGSPLLSGLAAASWRRPLIVSGKRQPARA